MTGVNTTTEARPAPTATPPGGREVFEILARENADMLTSFIRSLVQNHDAVDDLFQEAMLTAWRRLDSYDRSRPFAPWLRGIARHLVLRHRDRAPRDVQSCDPDVLDALEARYIELAKHPEQHSDTIERLAYCLQGLPERLAEAIHLVYEKGLGMRDVSQQLEASEEAIKKRVQRGRQLLADCLRRKEMTA